MAAEFTIPRKPDQHAWESNLRDEVGHRWAGLGLLAFWCRACWRSPVRRRRGTEIPEVEPSLQPTRLLLVVRRVRGFDTGTEAITWDAGVNISHSTSVNENLRWRGTIHPGQVA